MKKRIPHDWIAIEKKRVWLVVVEGYWNDSRVFTHKKDAEDYAELTKNSNSGVVETTLDNKKRCKRQS